MRRRSLPVVLADDAPPVFPDPREFDARGLVAIGGDLSVDRLLAAYDHGLFPCSSADEPTAWWCPDPRAVIPLDRLHVARRLARTIAARRFRVTFDGAFRAVMEGCDENRRDGQWIHAGMIESYCELHRLGHAHSFEVWDGRRLAGGLYGVVRGSLFAAESMFHRVTDASKVALVAAVRATAACGAKLFDVQFLTPHLARFGATEIPRASYLEQLAVRVRETAAYGALAADPEIDF